jgi:trigger factor
MRTVTLKVETQDLANRQLQMTVEVPAEKLEAAMRSAARRLATKTSIPGFRPGKAPYDVLLQRLGESAVFDEAIDTLGQQVYREALESTSLQPFAPGSFDEVVSQEPLVLRYTVPLQPVIGLGAYRDLRIPVESPEVTDEALESFLEELRQGQALIEPADRPAQLSDVVLVDIRAELPAQEEKPAETLLRQDGASVLVSEANDWPIPGIAERLVGLKAGDDRDFDYTFPEDYPTENLRGKAAHFHLQCHEVKSRFVPEWTNELARSLGDFEDLLDLRTKARKSLGEQARQRGEAEYREKVLQAVVDAASVEYPPQLLEEELTDLVRDLEMRLRSQKLSLADYLKIQKKTEQDIRADLEPTAQGRIKRGLVLSEVAEAEKIEATEEEVTAEIQKMVEQSKDIGDSLRKVFDNPTGRRRIAVDLVTEKAIARLASIARGEAQAEPVADAAAAAPAEQVEKE